MGGNAINKAEAGSLPSLFSERLKVVWSSTPVASRFPSCSAARKSSIAASCSFFASWVRPRYSSKRATSKGSPSEGCCRRSPAALDLNHAFQEAQCRLGAEILDILLTPSARQRIVQQSRHSISIRRRIASEPIQKTSHNFAIAKCSKTVISKSPVSSYENLIGIAPKDEIESMLAAQLIAAHNAAMECYRRAM